MPHAIARPFPTPTSLPLQIRPSKLHLVAVMSISAADAPANSGASIMPRFIESADGGFKLSTKEVVAILCAGVIPVIITTVAVVWLLACYGRTCCCSRRHRHGRTDSSGAEGTGSSSSFTSSTVSVIPLQDLPASSPVPLVPPQRKPSCTKSVLRKGNYAQNAEARHNRTNAALAMGLDRRPLTHFEPLAEAAGGPGRDSFAIEPNWPLRR
ncbi:hypothetical protein CC78DRAFT_129079 [Lojkania enalia]|uniref:Uncharacterized protein n=1 Tax=Lojkania enalia TaxID=147567 RepID=A0A9P4K012_9PLEO|nr:hypothetical protein CC78DRAFT_129079 [Didymosphaeria enalia]